MSKKILVAYTSKYGSTRKYAEWIASALNADLFAAQTVEPKVLSQYDIIIYGGGLYAGGIAGVKLVTQNPCKNLIMFTVGLANPHSTDYSAIINKNFTPELLERTKFFHLRGGIDYKKLSPVHKVMMAMMKGMIQRKPESEREVDDKEFLNTYNSKVNFEDKRTIDSIISYVEGL
ncbi:flavodoxin domain-containing protein [Marasmitruncus massiliensis]|uniref:flavodoxin domain-containing protein n=1 Tax=Marasmitruncus massiliensis TaxID=1944642 RepID=UPI000C7A9C05|nr:flavodoxin domain-containing protein [Marasmitruncus massiliensis]